ncbi:MAG: NAD(P)/FAD-dependent oxidoreductase [Sandaracinaceae bacterium]
MNARYDVLVIGGGPSGSTAATLLAARGARVLVLEREVFPRFHIGESLLPCDLDVFDRLGVDLSGQARHLRKDGAEFFDERTGDHAVYPFRDALTGTADHAWQVDRAAFDLALLTGAQRAGAEVHQGEAVCAVEAGPSRVEVRTGRARYQARYVVDASGQHALLARQHRTKRSLRAFGLAAAFRHYADLRPASVAALEATGNIRIHFVRRGWMWAIPLGQGRLSVGLVTRDKGLDDGWLDAALGESPTLGPLLAGARPEGPTRRIGSYSFHNDRPAGARWVCVGDAACFLDPVFSSGVSFGMVGAAHAADALVEALASGAEGDPDLMTAHGAWMHHAYTVFATLIRELYRGGLVPEIFFTPEQDPELRRGLTSMLAGDVWRDDNALQNALCSSPRRRVDVRAPPA